MRSKVLTFVSMVVLSASCGGSEKSVTEPALTSMPEPASAEGHLVIVPFVITTTATKSDGSQTIRVIRGDAAGILSAEENGAPTHMESTVESTSADEPAEVPESTVAP